MGGLLASACLRTVFLWMPNSLAIARMERPGSLACCTAFHRTLCGGVGFLPGDAGGLRTLPSPFNVVALSALMMPRDAKLSLGWLPTPLTLRSRSGPYRRHWRHGELQGAAAPPVWGSCVPGTAGGADRPVLMDLQLRSGVARPLLTRQQLHKVRQLYLTVLSLATLRRCLKQSIRSGTPMTP